MGLFAFFDEGGDSLRSRTLLMASRTSFITKRIRQVASSGHSGQGL
jgi:hypothetical protein